MLHGKDACASEVMYRLETHFSPGIIFEDFARTCHKKDQG